MHEYSHSINFYVSGYSISKKCENREKLLAEIVLPIPTGFCRSTISDSWQTPHRLIISPPVCCSSAPDLPDLRRMAEDCKSKALSQMGFNWAEALLAKPNIWIRAEPFCQHDRGELTWLLKKIQLWRDKEEVWAFIQTLNKHNFFLTSKKSTSNKI